MNQEKSNKKNIIIILIDALRPKNLSLFGYSKETDKNLKEIAEQSIVFKKFFTASNCTAPSVTSILTGKYPYNQGIIHQLPYTEEEEIQKIEKEKFWLPEYLKEKGYETIAIDWLRMWFKRGFDYYGEGEKDKTEIYNAPFRSANKITDLAISKIRQNKNSEKPFFLFLHFWDTHFPFPHTEYKSDKNNEDMKETLKNIKNESQREYLRKRISGKGLYTIQDMINKYDLSIKEIDKEIGRIYDFLKQENLLNETILFIMGDHGTNLTEHEIYFSPSGLYDESIHTLLIIYIPQTEPKEINEFVQNTDITPTILDYLDLKCSNFDGLSLLPLIKGNQSLPFRDKIFSVDGLGKEIKTIRTKNRKLILSKNNFCNLCKSSHHKKIEEYNLEKDPRELNNIYSGESELIKFLE